MIPVSVKNVVREVVNVQPVYAIRLHWNVVNQIVQIKNVVMMAVMVVAVLVQPDRVVCQMVRVVFLPTVPVLSYRNKV